LSNYARDDQIDPESTRTNPLETLGGDTSKDVDMGVGKPAYGEDSTELRNDGMHGRKHQRHGLEGTGATVDELTGRERKDLSSTHHKKVS
jgi:hypothetical protein